MRKTHIIKQGGFTLIEMLVVLAVILILPTIVIANFPKIKMQCALSRAAHKFSQDVRVAQDKALSAITYKDASGTPQLVSGYGIYIDMSALGGDKQYIIYADKQPGNQQYDVSDYTVATIDLVIDEPGVVIKELQN